MRPSDILEPYNNVLTIRTRVGVVPIYKMIEKFLWIEDPDGNKIRFILNEDQVDLYKSMCEQRLGGNPVRIDILKARQKGFSTFIAAVIFVSVIFNAGQKAAIVADIAEHASNLFDKYNYFYNNLPEELKIKKIKSNAKELVVEYPNGERSSIRIMVQGDTAGRSGTYQYLHLSECAFWQDLNKTLTSLLQTVSNANKNSMVFLETTANGVNDYKMRWDRDYSGLTSYLPRFYAWFTTERYRVDKVEEYEKPIWLKEYQDKYNLDEYQTKWFFDKWNEFNGDLDYLRQEFPTNAVEAFVTSGNSVFNAELLRIRKEEIMKESPLIKKGDFRYTKKVSQDGGRIEIFNLEFVESRLGAVKIYEEPNPLHPYICSNDPAMGGEDYFAIQVFDNYTGKQVAVYHKNKCDADDCAYQLYALGRYYNDAMITGETNTTAYILQTVMKCGYKFIYQDQDIEDLGTKFYNKLGYKTKTTNRQQMIEMFQVAFRDDPTIIRDYETICEMENFQVVRTGRSNIEKAMATGGAHDDLVMAICGFYLCRGQQRATPTKEAIKREESIYEIEKKVEERRRALNEKNKRKVFSIWD